MSLQQAFFFSHYQHPIHIGPNRIHPDRSSCLNLSANGLNGLTDQWRFLPSIQQDKISVLSILKCMDGSVLAFLECTDGSVWTQLNGPTLGFPLKSDPTRFPQSGNSGVSQLLCKKSNTTSYLKQNVSYRTCKTNKPKLGNIYIAPKQFQCYTARKK